MKIRSKFINPITIIGVFEMAHKYNELITNWRENTLCSGAHSIIQQESFLITSVPVSTKLGTEHKILTRGYYQK